MYFLFLKLILIIIYYLYILLQILMSTRKSLKAEGQLRSLFGKVEKAASQGKFQKIYYLLLLNVFSNVF